MNKKDLVLEIFQALNDNDLINHNQSDYCGNAAHDSLKVIEEVLNKYVVLDGEILL